MPTSTSSGHPIPSGNVDHIPETLFLSGDGTYRNPSITALLPEDVYTTSLGSTALLPGPELYSMHYLTLTSNCTFTFVPAVTGRSFVMALVQGGSGSNIVTWPASVKWPSGTPPTLSTSVSAVDYLTFMSLDGSTWAGFVCGLSVS